MNTQEYIEENRVRLEKINKPYDPIMGDEYGDVIKRNLLYIPDAPIPRQFIPVEMEDEPIVKALRACGSLANATAGILGGTATEQKKVKIWLTFIKKRLKYDFEFFCATEINIVHKTKATIVPFFLNRAQRFYLETLELLRKENKPIDVILLKARQWGGSTMTQFYMFWIQMYWRRNWNSVICADVDDQAKGVLGMLTRAAELYDTDITDGVKVELKPYMRTDSTRELNITSCTISVGSAQHPEKIRSQNISMAHLTEVGLWKSTPTRTPEDLVQSIFGSIASGPYTLKILESTAKGVGNYFHRTWIDACDRKNNFTPVFVPWFMIDFYSTPIVDYPQFISTMTDYDRFLFELGATLEAIKWYKIKSREFKDKWRMCSEFPSTATEAFQSTGRNFYPIEYVEELRKGCCAPILVGEITAEEQKGENALNDIRIVEESNGNLKVWNKPDTSVKMSNRYLVVVDIGGRSEKADNSVICVFDRYWMHEAGGVPEVVAEWCGHIEWDLLAWKAAQIATIYNNALLVVESNTLETKGTEGNHFNILLTEIAEFYENMYRRTKQEQLVKGGAVRYGFHTNSSTKPMVCDFQLQVLRDGLYIERCNEAVDEHKTFEIKENGEYGAVQGNRDDRHITRAIGNYFNYKVMPAPQFITETNHTYIATKKIVNEYSL